MTDPASEPAIDDNTSGERSPKTSEGNADADSDEERSSIVRTAVGALRAMMGAGKDESGDDATTDS